MAVIGSVILLKITSVGLLKNDLLLLIDASKIVLSGVKMKMLQHHRSVLILIFLTSLHTASTGLIN